MQYQITRSYPDGVDEDFRIDAFDIAGIGSRIPIDQALALHKAGHRFYTVGLGVRAEVVERTHPTSFRRYLTTLPDGYKANNLSSLAWSLNPNSALANSLRGFLR